MSISLVLTTSPRCTHILHPQPPVHLTGFGDNGDCLCPEKRQPAFQSVLGINRTREGRDQVQLNHTKESLSHATDLAGQTPSRMRMSLMLVTLCKGMFCRLWWAQGTILCPSKGQEGRERMIILLNSDRHRRCSRFCGSCKSNKISMFSIYHPCPLRI